MLSYSPAPNWGHAPNKGHSHKTLIFLAPCGPILILKTPMAGKSFKLDDCEGPMLISIIFFVLSLIKCRFFFLKNFVFKVSADINICTSLEP